MRLAERGERERRALLRTLVVRARDRLQIHRLREREKRVRVSFHFVFLFLFLFSFPSFFGLFNNKFFIFRGFFVFGFWQPLAIL